MTKSSCSVDIIQREVGFVVVLRADNERHLDRTVYICIYACLCRAEMWVWIADRFARATSLTYIYVLIYIHWFMCQWKHLFLVNLYTFYIRMCDMAYSYLKLMLRKAYLLHASV